MTTTASMATPRSLAVWRSLLILLIAASVFDLLFWHRDMGVNLPMYALLIAGTLIARHGWYNLSGAARATAAGLLVACFFSVWHNSVVSIIASFICLFLFAAFAHETELRSIWFGIAQAIGNFVMTPIGASGSVSVLLEDRKAARSGWYWLKLALIPIVLLVVYFSMYRAANPMFDEYTAGFLDAIGEWIGSIFEEILTPHLLFFLFALLVSGALLFRNAPRLLANHERSFTDTLLRKRTKRAHWLAPLGMNALDRERRMGLILLVMMNALLLAVNAIDIGWVWFGFEVPKDFSLKQFVHEGTWLLIISILLSMAILLHLFRGNLNFHFRSGPLRTLAFVWIAQNFILGISVFLRNYHYIHFHGLAYKRIGVIVFLALVLVGLVTLYLKIRDRRSFYHLLRVNAWAAFAALIGLTTVNWDGVITRYNLGHWNKGEIDVDNYLAMSDKVLPILYANRAAVEEQIQKHVTNETVWISRTSMSAFAPDLEAKRIAFLRRWEDRDWQEWNRADAGTWSQLEKMGLTGM